MTQKPKLLVDADITLFQSCSAAEDEIDWGDDVWSLAVDLKEAKRLVTKAIDELKTRFDTDDVTLCLSDPSGNFRKQLNPEYKSNRKKSRKPVGYATLREWVEKEYHTEQRPNLEADDVIGIMATLPKNKGAEVVVVSDDKDLKTIPCKLFRPRSEELTLIDPDTATYHFFYQTLVGDSTDGYKGCPSIGDVKARKILDEECSWAAVVRAFEGQGLTVDDALMQARMARILHYTDWNKDKQEVVSWEP